MKIFGWKPLIDSYFVILPIAYSVAFGVVLLGMLVDSSITLGGAFTTWAWISSIMTFVMAIQLVGHMHTRRSHKWWSLVHGFNLKFEHTTENRIQIEDKVSRFLWEIKDRIIPFIMGEPIRDNELFSMYYPNEIRFKSESDMIMFKLKFDDYC